MTDILNNLDTLLENGEVVYLHCHGGVGRTGLTVACYLVHHGLSGESALAQLTNLRKDTPNAWKRSPETDEQWRFVLDWGA
jgi:protein-tyrosine phosphatase